MWRRRRAERKRQHRARAQHCPVRRRIKPVAPGVRALDLAAIEVRHRRVEFSRREFAQCVDRLAGLSIRHSRIVDRRRRNRPQTSGRAFTGKTP